MLGIIEQDGEARWTHLWDEEGQPFSGKIEGLTLDPNARSKVYFVIDDDDEDNPSFIFEAMLSEQFFAAS